MPEPVITRRVLRILALSVAALLASLFDSYRPADGVQRGGEDPGLGR